MNEKFQIIGGSVCGTAHRLRGKNNQDAFCWAQTREFSVAFVSDGCSSSPDSEIGSKLLARAGTDIVMRLLARYPEVRPSEILKKLESSLVGFVRSLAEKFSDPVAAIDHMFLATLTGFVIGPRFATVFSFGDGLVAVNGRITIINQDNLPSYIAYKAKPGAWQINEKKLEFVIRDEQPAEEVESFLIASDGAAELEKKANQAIPVLGSEEKIGGISQFLTDERYLKNPSLLQKRLFSLNAEKFHVNWEEQEVSRSGGILSDDTTIVLAKRSLA